jgi:ABC-2 type transport system ATP-binding protein
LVDEGVVTLRGVSKRYGESRALSGVSFSVAQGQGIGYLGPNGAGKTTTLRLMTGLTRADEGTVRVLGVDPAKDPVGALRNVGALIETPGLLPFLHGRDLLEHAAEVRGVPRVDRPTTVRRAAERMGVAEELDRALGGLSTGLSRRVLLAGTLVGDPRLLLLDEPTLGLDPAARHDLRATLATLRAEGRTLLLSTHLLEDVEATCDRVLFLREGRLMGDEPVRSTHGSGPSAAKNELMLRFRDPVDASRLRPLLRSGEEMTLESDNTYRFSLLTGDDRQVEFLGALVSLGFPLLEASPAGSDLEQRYLRAVGREDAP